MHILCEYTQMFGLPGDEARLSPAAIKSVVLSPSKDSAFTLDGSALCTGTHPDEQSQGIIIMPDEHVHVPSEVWEAVLTVSCASLQTLVGVVADRVPR